MANFYNTGTCNNFAPSTYTLNNCFTLEGKIKTINTALITEKTEEYMKSADFTKDLNDFIDEDTTIADKTRWKRWVYRINDFPSFT